MKKLATLTVNDVSSVYSGKLGCACGCRGKHSYNSKHTVWASTNRGYKVQADEINDKRVLQVLRKVQRHAANGNVVDSGDRYFSFQNETRLYVVYLKGGR